MCCPASGTAVPRPRSWPSRGGSEAARGVRVRLGPRRRPRRPHRAGQSAAAGGHSTTPSRWSGRGSTARPSPARALPHAWLGAGQRLAKASTFGRAVSPPAGRGRNLGRPHVRSLATGPQRILMANWSVHHESNRVRQAFASTGLSRSKRMSRFPSPDGDPPTVRPPSAHR